MKNDISTDVQTPRGTFRVRDTQEGYPLVCVHGWPQSSYCWQGLVPLLADKFRLIRPDTRGMGDSLRTLPVEDYLKQNLALDMLGVLDALGIEEFGLIGHDWGGAIVQEMALLQPERIQRLAILNMMLINNTRANLEVREVLKERGYTHNWYQTFQQQPNLPEAMITGNEEAWVGHFLKMAKGRTFPEDALQEYFRTFKIPHSATSSANYYRALYQDMKRWATLGGQKFQMPGLYIHGYKDVVIIPEYLNYIEDCFTASVEVVRLEAGHFVQEEMPDEVATSLSAFFAPLVK